MKVSALTTPSIAPSYPLSRADQAAHLAARGGVRHLRTTDAGWFPVAASDPGDSDPDMDEALRRATSEVAYIERDDAWRTEYREFVGEVAA